MACSCSTPTAGLRLQECQSDGRRVGPRLPRSPKWSTRAGFEFILPIARWKGFGGGLDVRTLCFETFTFASALSAMTEQITIFFTVHVPVVHPVFAAKALVTVDHVSGSRAGLNIVAGWNQGEFDMFGHAPAEHDRPYEQGLEWFDVMSKIFTSKERFDHDGEFYKLNRQLDTNEIFNERKRYAGSLSSHPLIGRPEKIVDELVRLQSAGIDGVTLSFVNFKNELPSFIDRVLPLLRQPGLRQ